MSWAYNIDVEKAQDSKRWPWVVGVLLLLVVALFVALGGSRASYTLADEGSHVFVLAEDQDIKVGLTEPAWTVNKGLEQLPGSCLAKNPVIENQASDCYLRVNFRITDKETGELKEEEVQSATIDPTASDEAKKRCETILKMIWFDRGENLKEGTSYLYSTLAGMVPSKLNGVFNDDEFEPQFPSTEAALNGWNDEMKAYSFLYKNAETENVFKEGGSTTFFTHLVMPADYGNDEFYLAGDYYINVWVQAIQTSPDFEGRDDAISALSNANVDNNMSTIDGEEVAADSAHRKL